MPIEKIYTIGVFGYNEEQFFEKLIQNKVDFFIDVRRRRAVRGSKYSFVNSAKLQKKLKDLSIKYTHILSLAPTNEIRSIQKNSDLEKGIKKVDRELLSLVFIKEYEDKILSNFDLGNLIKTIDSQDIKRPVFFCVEKNHNACHRSIISAKLSNDYNLPTLNI